MKTIQRSPSKTLENPPNGIVCDFDFCDGRHEAVDSNEEDTDAGPDFRPHPISEVEERPKSAAISLEKVISIEPQRLRWSDIPSSLRWKLNKNPNIDYCDPETYGSKWFAFNGGWCKTSLLDPIKECEKGLRCEASHCPPNRAVVELFISMGGPGIQFVFDCLEVYNVKYYMNSTLR